MKITEPLHTKIIAAISQHRLADNFFSTVETYFWPLAKAIADKHQRAQRSIVIGINGSQGSGKSTLADFLALLLEHANLRCAVLSIDDLYLTNAQRQQLAKTIHPLFATRGVPGTHDVALGVNTIRSLINATAETITPLPRFNKAIDDRFPCDEWPQFTGVADIIILEGWCVGAQPQSNEQLISPINSLEAIQDADARWRQHVNNTLANDYPALFTLIDWQVMLAAPSFECVFQWRKEQEDKLAEHISQTGGNRHGIMNDDALKFFIQHYERITRQLLIDMPARSHWLFTLADDHQIIAAQLNREHTTAAHLG